MQRKQPSPVPVTGEYTWRRIYQLVLNHKPRLIKAHIIAIFAVLSIVSLPMLLPLLVDEVLLENPGLIVGILNNWIPEVWQTAIGYIVAITIITIILRMTGVALGVWQMQQFTVISKEVTYQIRSDLLQRVQKVAMAQYETLGTGSVTSTMVSDVNTIDTFLGTTVGKLIISIFTLIGVSIVLLWLNWQLALFILLMNPLVIYFTVVMGRKVKTLKKDENSAIDIFQQSLTETLDALQQIRVSNQEKSFFERIQGKAYNIKTHSEAFTWKSDAASRISFLIFLIGFDIFRGVAMLMVVFADLTIGQMMAVFGYLWFMMTPVQDILAIQYSYSAASGALQRINNVLDLKQEPNYPQKQNPFLDVNKPVEVTVKDLCFKYQGKDELVLNNLSFKIKSGEKLALVGASGGGKTTLSQLLLGLYEYSAGEIYYNNAPLKQISQETLRKQVAIVLQQPILFNNTISFNLTLGQDIAEKHIWQALAMSQMTETIKSLDNQLESIVGRNGIKLSGGQRQRLAIARMILQNPKVVIMDEATSALDMETERLLYQDLAPFFTGRTVLIIAHRLSSIKQADRILVFDNGKIIESGSHSELLEQGGTYNRLYK